MTSTIDPSDKVELLPENLDAFRQRFHTFHDGLIRSVRQQTYYDRNRKPPRSYDVAIILSVKEGAIDDNQWTNLHLYIEDCTTFSFARHRNHSFSVIFSFNVAFIGGEFCFGDFTLPDGDTDAAYIDQFASSGFFVAGKRCFWHIAPYKDFPTFTDQRKALGEF